MAIYGSFLYGTTLYGAVAVSPKLVDIRPSARFKIDLTFDSPVRVRNRDLVPVAPTSQLVPVDWIGRGGTTEDAANPDNYTITRPVGGYLDGGGEAVDLVTTWADGIDGYTSEVVEGADIIIYSTKVRIYTDHQQSSRADYHLVVANLVKITAGPAITAPDDEGDFAGWIVSQVARSSLHLFDILPSVAQKLDNDGTGDLRKFCTPLQEMFDRITEDIDVFFDELSSIEKIREEFIDGMLYDLGDQFREKLAMSLIEKRRLSRSLVGMYKLKGTCVGLVNAVEFFLGITMTGCVKGWEGTGGLYKGTYPTPTGGDLDLYKGAYPAPTGGSGWLGPSSAQVRNFWLVHPTPGALTADELEKIAVIVDLMMPADGHYMGVIAP